MQNKKQKIDFEIFLHDIRSVQNVASIFRLADCVGASKIVLSGITPGPKDRFERVREDFIKISLGSEKDIKNERIGQEIQNESFKTETDGENLKNALDYINKFKKNKGIVIALEQSEKSLDYKEISEIIKSKVNVKNFKKENKKENKNESEIKFLIIPGREVEGLDEQILKKADYIAEIPQYGNKESLNIFSSLAIVLYKWFDL
jgi:23S rRNA (guanosine2251-2'-O)-methyltransferase